MGRRSVAGLLTILAAVGICFAASTPMGATDPSELHTLQVLFCTSWGMSRNFHQLKEFLEQHFPELANGAIKGGNYPAPAWATIASQAISFLQIFTMMAVFTGDAIWNYIPFVQGAPSWYYSMKQNSAVVFIGIFLIIPTVIQSHITTGAFEVMLDGEVIYSKLASGRMPSGNDILKPLIQAGLRDVK